MNFRELKEAVFLQTPILKKTLETKGELRLLDYFEENIHFPTHTSSSRQEEFLFVVKKMVTELIDPTIADSATSQLRQHYYASTADHHGPITHPFFVNSHLAQSFVHSKHRLNNIFVFSCGGISLNNSSFPRGILFHDRELNEKRIRFVSLKNRHHPVFGFPAYTKQEFKKRITGQQDTLLDKKIKNVIEQVYLDEKIFSHSWYSDQISRTNYTLWKKIPGQQNTNLIYLEQESIVNQLLLKYHLSKDTLITRLLINESILDAFEMYFDGIQGAYSSVEDKGTTLFWVIHEGKRKQLKRRKNILESTDGSYQIALNPTSLKEAIEKKELMPSMALSFIVLSFYYGLTCGGGFLQVNYLTQLKEAYLRLLKKIGENEEHKSVESIKTNYFCGEFVFTTLGSESNIAHASSIDLIVYGNPDTYTRLQELARVCTLGEAVNAMMPNFYKILFGKEPQVTLPPLNFLPSLYVKKVPLLRQ